MKNFEELMSNTEIQKMRVEYLYSYLQEKYGMCFNGIEHLYKIDQFYVDFLSNHGNLFFDQLIDLYAKDTLPPRSWDNDEIIDYASSLLLNDKEYTARHTRTVYNDGIIYGFNINKYNPLGKQKIYADSMDGALYLYGLARKFEQETGIVIQLDKKTYPGVVEVINEKYKGSNTPRLLQLGNIQYITLRMSIYFVKSGLKELMEDLIDIIRE